MATIPTKKPLENTDQTLSKNFCTLYSSLHQIVNETTTNEQRNLLSAILNETPYTLITQLGKTDDMEVSAQILTSQNRGEISQRTLFTQISTTIANTRTKLEEILEVSSYKELLLERLPRAIDKLTQWIRQAVLQNEETKKHQHLAIVAPTTAGAEKITASETANQPTKVTLRGISTAGPRPRETKETLDKQTKKELLQWGKRLDFPNLNPKHISQIYTAIMILIDRDFDETNLSIKAGIEYHVARKLLHLDWREGDSVRFAKDLEKFIKWLKNTVRHNTKDLDESEPEITPEKELKQWKQRLYKEGIKAEEISKIFVAVYGLIGLQFSIEEIACEAAITNEIVVRKMITIYWGPDDDTDHKHNIIRFKAWLAIQLNKRIRELQK